MNQEILVLYNEICIEKIFWEYKPFAVTYKRFQI